MASTVSSLLLKMIRTDFIHEADATSLLPDIENDSLARLLDRLHRTVELRPAVTAVEAEVSPVKHSE